MEKLYPEHIWQKEAYHLGQVDSLITKANSLIERALEVSGIEQQQFVLAIQLLQQALEEIDTAVKYVDAVRSKWCDIESARANFGVLYAELAREKNPRLQEALRLTLRPKVDWFEACNFLEALE